MVGPPVLQEAELEREGLTVPLFEAGLAEAALRGVDEQMEQVDAATVVADPTIRTLTVDRIMVEDQHVSLQTVFAVRTNGRLLDRNVALASLAADEVANVRAVRNLCDSHEQSEDSGWLPLLETWLADVTRRGVDQPVVATTVDAPLVHTWSTMRGNDGQGRDGLGVHRAAPFEHNVVPPVILTRYKNNTATNSTPKVCYARGDVDLSLLLDGGMSTSPRARGVRQARRRASEATRVRFSAR